MRCREEDIAKDGVDFGCLWPEVCQEQDRQPNRTTLACGIDEELRAYCSKSAIDLVGERCEDGSRRVVDPLQWWAAHGRKFPRLAAMARRVLCVMPTSVQCERVFSKGGWLNKRRCSLSAETRRRECFYRVI